MRRNAILALGWGVLLGIGTVAPGCGGTNTNKKDGAVEAKKDAGSTGGAVGKGGSTGAGGATGSGGSTGTGGATSSGGAPGTGGSSGVDAEAKLDSGIDSPATKLDSIVDEGTGTDARDVPITTDTGVDGELVLLDTGGIDIAIDQAGTSIDATPRACTTAGGFCTAYHFEVCPAHYEPAAADEHLTCSGSEVGANGRCCVPAPSSPCSDTGAGNCVAGDSCTGCWEEAPGTPACEAGRVCCIYMCN